MEMWTAKRSTILNTFWWTFIQDNGMRGRQEQRGMKLDFTLKITGKEYITYDEGITKNSAE